jgi:hypothetical protein
MIEYDLLLFLDYVLNYTRISDYEVASYLIWFMFVQYIYIAILAE